MEIATDPQDFVAKAEALMALSPEAREAWLKRVDAYLATTSWDRTWGSMAGLIEQHRQQRTPHSRVTRLPVANPTSSTAAEGASNV